MKKLLVRGGRPLFGKIDLQGSKNAALPIIFATIITRGVSTLKNVPDITDVTVALDIIRDMGASVTREGSTLYINTERLVYKTPNEAFVSKIRASTYLLGACLGRFGIAEIMNFGGCDFGTRPIDLHIAAALSLGADLNDNIITAKRLNGGTIKLKKPSVGASVNAIIMSCCAEGSTEIYGYAKEPHVYSVIDYLKSCGASITEQDERLIIEQKPLFGGEYTVIPDMIEAGTYLLLCILGEGGISVTSSVAPSLRSFICAAADSGIAITADGRHLTFFGRPTRPFSVTTAPYPGYPTDLQPQLAPLMAMYFGGEIRETVWQGRFGYLGELERFGIKSVTDGSLAKILPSHLKPARVSAPDLRGGAACLFAALLAKGESEIYSADYLLRGYSRLEENLTSLGADVKII
ncbi:MAG: UDP-N-acetylglucosamine 1-carboxyvinyltransferase [Clostridia bacterium]|nr:UDP-N-acetylglucosamine 1-carboxyvinyltransferase [Clostridia bacterium]